MAFNIKNDRADELLRELTELTGESLTTAVIESLRERLERTRRMVRPAGAIDPLDAAVAHLRAIVSIPAGADADEALGYDQHGLPT